MVFFFNDTSTTEIYTLSLHDALPISARQRVQDEQETPQRRRENPENSAARSGEEGGRAWPSLVLVPALILAAVPDRKSTRLNSSHANISYAVFCLIKTILLITISFMS